MAKWIRDFRQGDTYRLKIEYPVGTILTGYKHWLTLRKDFGEQVSMQVSSVFGDHPEDDAGNLTTRPVAFLEASPAVTALLASGKYIYDVQAKSSDGGVLTLAPPPTQEEYKDKVFVAPQVTEES